MRDDHPRWCSPRCEASLGRYHSSEPLVIAAVRGETARLSVRIWGPDIEAPLIELAVGDHDDGHRCRTDLSVRQARALYGATGHVLDAISDVQALPPHIGFSITGRDAT